MFMHLLTRVQLILKHIAHRHVKTLNTSVLEPSGETFSTYLIIKWKGYNAYHSLWAIFVAQPHDCPAESSPYVNLTGQNDAFFFLVSITFPQAQWQQSLFGIWALGVWPTFGTIWDLDLAESNPLWESGRKPHPETPPTSPPPRSGWVGDTVFFFVFFSVASQVWNSLREYTQKHTHTRLFDELWVGGGEEGQKNTAFHTIPAQSHTDGAVTNYIYFFLLLTFHPVISRFPLKCLIYFPSRILVFSSCLQMKLWVLVEPSSCSLLKKITTEMLQM